MNTTERTAKVVTGALSDAIRQHGPITCTNLPSAVKRVVAGLRSAGESRVYNGEATERAAVDAANKRLEKLRHGHARLIDQHARLRDRLAAADALCEAWERELAYNDGEPVERPELEAFRAVWLASRPSPNAAQESSS